MDNWETLERQLEPWLEAANARVVRWAWFPGSAELDAPVPVWVERDGRHPATAPLSGAPKDPARAVRHGYDIAGRLLVGMRTDNHGRVVEVTAWGRLPHGDEVQFYATGFSGQPLGLARVAIPEYDGGDLKRVTLYYDPRENGGQVTETYAYDNTGNLSQIDVVRITSRDKEYERFEARRDAQGELVVLVGWDDDGYRIVYRRPDSEEARAAKRLFERRILELVPQWVSRNRESTSAFCLGLIYSFDEPRLPPMLGLGVIENLPRGDLPDDNFVQDVFAVVDPEPDEFDEPDFQEACRVLTQEWRSREDDAEPRRTLVAVAKELAKMDWPGPANGPRASMIFAVDDEGIDLDRNLRAAGFRQA